ncbi:MAG TPA: kelch repeat-containing protein [Aggregicoccus sp.]|nr:kelch repeat-containing protein [Aggregicoccus sp.]
MRVFDSRALLRGWVLWRAAPLFALAALGGCGFEDPPLRPVTQPPPAPQPLPPPPPPAALCWTKTGEMQEYRGSPGALLLADGRVLVVGGVGGSEGQSVTSAELYDPATGAWTLTAPMRERRADPAVVQLEDGRVLVAGGWTRPSTWAGGSSFHATAELYDPATNTWSSAAPMRHERSSPTGLRLPDGRVLVSFGILYGPDNALELYDPAQNAWTELPDPPWVGVRAGRPALLPDGRPFFASALLSAAYDAASGAWQEAASKQGGGLQRLWAFPDGRVLSPRSFSDGAGELYAPAADRWTRTGGYLEPRETEELALLHDGRLLLAGGVRPREWLPLASSEHFDPDTGAWAPAGRMAQPRYDHVLVTLKDGRVLAAGGVAGPEWVRTAELFDPACPGPRQGGLPAPQGE